MGDFGDFPQDKLISKELNRLEVKFKKFEASKGKESSPLCKIFVFKDWGQKYKSSFDEIGGSNSDF